MAAKCEMFMNYSRKCLGICRKQIWLPNMKYWREQRCGGTDVQQM